MKAKDLLKAYFKVGYYKGARMTKIVRDILDGEINPSATYIQTFKDDDFWPYNPDVTFVTTAGETCYLFKVD